MTQKTINNNAYYQMTETEQSTVSALMTGSCFSRSVEINGIERRVHISGDEHHNPSYLVDSKTNIIIYNAKTGVYSLAGIDAFKINSAQHELPTVESSGH